MKPTARTFQQFGNSDAMIIRLLQGFCVGQVNLTQGATVLTYLNLCFTYGDILIFQGGCHSFSWLWRVAGINTNASILWVGSVSANGIPFLVMDITSSAFHNMSMQNALEKLWPSIICWDSWSEQRKRNVNVSLLILKVWRWHHILPIRNKCTTSSPNFHTAWEQFCFVFRVKAVVEVIGYDASASTRIP